jgi:glyoxylase-like metal-dependent hydrolase (beta-lactamase superfamily II)
VKKHLARLCASVSLCLCVFSVSAFAQIDLAGEWTNLTHEDLNHRQSVEIGDYTGLPINEAGRYKSESWDEAVLATHERQCIPHPVTYAMRGQPGNIRIGKIADPDTAQIIAYTMHGTYGRPRTIWMDGRDHPSENAPHTWAGFSTGKWEGNALVVTTTHIKMGWIMRNGVPTSDRATMTERFIRHGNLLLDVIIVNDPVYLSEPFIRTQDWRLNLTGEPNAYGPCGPAQIADEIPNQKKGYVPHHLPGTNVQMNEFPAKRRVPPEAALGGAETTYPEYMLKLRGQPAAAAVTRVTPASAKANNTRKETVPTIEVLPVQGNVYAITGAGANIAVQIGDDGVVLVDTGVAASNERVMNAIRQLSSKPIRFVVNTNARADHTGANEQFARSGRKMGGGLLVGGYAGDGAMVIAHEAVLKAMSAPTGKTPPTPSGGWPTDSYPGVSKEIYANNEGISILHPGAANTNGDSIAYFRRSDVVVTGDIFSMTSYPVIDVDKGGSFSGVIDGLNRIIEITIPKDWQEGGTMVIPGHGRVADEADVVEYRDMITIIRDRIQDMIRKGMTLEQIKAARPTRDYDGRYGDPTAMIEAAYRELRV